MRHSIRMGKPYGLDLMKFTLTYDGELPACGGSSRRVAEKWDIRKQLDPQLRELWAVSPVLQAALKERIIPNSGFMRMESHHSVIKEPFYPARDNAQSGEIDLCANIPRGNRQFLPLVRESLALTCGLKIKFLRKEEPGKLIYQGGDIDNRLKTLFDALSVPTPEQIVEDNQIEDPIYCLLEDDRMITSLEVETQKLLSRPGASQHEVRLIIDVDVRVVKAALYNSIFLGE